MAPTDQDMQTVNTLGIVLVVDDEPGIRQLARRILEGAGYGVVEAKDGVDGLRVIEAGTPVDFLMADLDMPEMRGDEMAIEIRARRKFRRLGGRRGRNDHQRQSRASYDGHSWFWTTIAELGRPKSLSAARGASGSATQTLSSTTKE